MTPSFSVGFRPAFTGEALEKALAGAHAFRIDYSARELLFKTAEG